MGFEVTLVLSFVELFYATFFSFLLFLILWFFMIDDYLEEPFKSLKGVEVSGDYMKRERLGLLQKESLILSSGLSYVV